MTRSSEPETEPNSITPQLQLTSLPYLKSTQHSATLTPLTPLHTSASVPFKWEQEPGKPLSPRLPSNDQNLIKCLELPPRLVNDTKFTKLPSPTIVLEGPYSILGRSILGSSSFRFLRKREKSFDNGAVSFRGSWGSSPDRGLFGSCRKTGGDAHKGSFVFPSLSDDGADFVEVTRVTSKRFQSGLSNYKTNFWSTIYGAFKQVIPRRSTKWKKNGM